MPKWQYACLYYHHRDGVEVTFTNDHPKQHWKKEQYWSALSTLGEQGWELVSQSGNDAFQTMYFKRSTE